VGNAGRGGQITLRRGSSTSLRSLREVSLLAERMQGEWFRRSEVCALTRKPITVGGQRRKRADAGASSRSDAIERSERALLI
jgi:hypothetical protein